MMSLSEMEVEAEKLKIMNLEKIQLDLEKKQDAKNKISKILLKIIENDIINRMACGNYKHYKQEILIDLDDFIRHKDLLDTTINGPYHFSS
jgi:hypothetical protein